jgi:spoIIIJ-associated protein
VAEALQSLCDAMLVVRGDASSAVEVLLPAVVEGDGTLGLADEDEALVQAALRLGRLAAAQKRTFALGPMSANERRLVHNALSELAGVRTQSEGEGIYRRLWVLPRG